MMWGWCCWAALANWAAVAYAPTIRNPSDPAMTDSSPMWSTGSSANARTVNGVTFIGGRNSSSSLHLGSNYGSSREDRLLIDLTGDAGILTSKFSWKMFYVASNLNINKALLRNI